MTLDKIYPHEWWFSERGISVTIFARNENESVSRLIQFTRHHLMSPINQSGIYWDSANDVGYVDEREI